MATIVQLADWGHMGAMGWWPIVVAAAVVPLTILGVTLWATRRPMANAGRPSEDVLGDRYARGEIEEDEYRHRLRVLREHP